MFRCKIKDCGEEFEDEGDLGMHLMWRHDLAEEVTEEEGVITQEMRKERAIEHFNGLVAEMDKNVEEFESYRK